MGEQGECKHFDSEPPVQNICTNVDVDISRKEKPVMKGNYLQYTLFI